jgi:soluble lytic murein transglycosylase-like protein
MSPAQLGPMVGRAAQTFGVPEGLVHAFIGAESGGKPEAVSSRGATGLMQITRGTALSLGYQPSDRRDPEKNVQMGTKLLSQLNVKYGRDIDKVAAAYLVGEKYVDRAGGDIAKITDNPYYTAREIRAYVNGVKRRLGRTGATSAGVASAGAASAGTSAPPGSAN